MKLVQLFHLLILFCLVFLGAPHRYILCSLFFLIYIKSNHIVSTFKQLAADDTIFHCCAKTLAGELNQYSKANLNGHPSICHLIQIRIRLKKLHFHNDNIIHVQTCFNIYLLKFYLNEKLKLYRNFQINARNKLNSRVRSNILSLHKV